MKIAIVLSFFAGLGAAVLRPAQEQDDMEKAMGKAKQFMNPGKNHEALKKYIGSFTTETTLFMGDKSPPAEKGTAEGTWLMEGRWVAFDAKGNLFGRPFRSYTLMGYDNFRKSYVKTTVSSFDTAMNRVEGDFDPKTGALVTYGTLDEYMTGEVAKPIKVVWRFPSDDKFVMEVHDLAIGESNTKVFEVAYTRKK